MPEKLLVESELQ